MRCFLVEKGKTMSNLKCLSEHQCNIILAIAEASMNITLACKIYQMAQSSMYYQIERIKVISGKNPRNFYDLCELVQYVKKGNNNDT